jgi:hypothetical protein
VVRVLRARAERDHAADEGDGFVQGLIATFSYIKFARVSLSFLSKFSLHISTEPQGIPEANPTITSYNASAVKIYNTTNSPVRFENKNIFFYIKKRSSPLQRWLCSCKFVKS